MMHHTDFVTFKINIYLCAFIMLFVGCLYIMFYTYGHRQTYTNENVSQREAFGIYIGFWVICGL